MLRIVAEAGDPEAIEEYAKLKEVVRKKANEYNKKTKIEGPTESTDAETDLASQRGETCARKEAVSVEWRSPTKCTVEDPFFYNPGLPGLGMPKMWPVGVVPGSPSGVSCSKEEDTPVPFDENLFRSYDDNDTMWPPASRQPSSAQGPVTESSSTLSQRLAEVQSAQPSASRAMEYSIEWLGRMSVSRSASPVGRVGAVQPRKARPRKAPSAPAAGPISKGPRIDETRVTRDGAVEKWTGTRWHRMVV